MRWARWLAIALAVVAVLAYAGISVAFYLNQAEWIHASPRDRRGGPQAHGLAGVEERIAVLVRGGHSEALASSPAAQSLAGDFLRSPGPLASPAACLAKKGA